MTRHLHMPPDHRNQWQQNLLPDIMPADQQAFADPQTGVYWTPPDAQEELAARLLDLHQIDTDKDGSTDTTEICWRGELPQEKVEELRQNPDFQDAFNQIRDESVNDLINAAVNASFASPGLAAIPLAAAAYVNTIDSDDVTPGLQACYDPVTDTRTNSATFDYASPNDSVVDHFLLDVATHSSDRIYADYPQSSGADYSGGTTASDDASSAGGGDTSSAGSSSGGGSPD